jgi:hypothetical protein
MNEMFEEFNVYQKIGAAISGIAVLSAICSRIFAALVKHFIIKYFENQELALNAAFRRIDEQRNDFISFKLTEYRDYKRDVAVKILELTESVKELYNRTNNYDEVKKTVEFCDDKNKTGSNQKCG